MRSPEWRPSDPVASATRRALAWWQERNPRRRRPTGDDEREQFLSYAFTMRLWTPEQIHYVADSVLKRTKGNWPDHQELEEELEAIRQRHAARVAAHTQKPSHWSGREDEPCPNCGTMPAYTIAQGTHIDHWAYLAPDCKCSGFEGMSSPSLWLRGIPARPEDDPVALAALHRDIASGVVTEWRKTGRALASVVTEMAEQLEAQRTRAASRAQVPVEVTA